MGDRRVPYADPGWPDVRSPGRFLWWLVLAQKRHTAAGSLWGSLWMCGLILPPYLVSRALDAIGAEDVAAFARWIAALLAAAPDDDDRPRRRDVPHGAGRGAPHRAAGRGVPAQALGG